MPCIFQKNRTIYANNDFMKYFFFLFALMLSSCGPSIDNPSLSENSAPNNTEITQKNIIPKIVTQQETPCRDAYQSLFVQESEPMAYFSVDKQCFVMAENSQFLTW